MMAAGFKSVKSQSLRECVEDRIRAAIFSGKLRPGDALREMHLARELQVSQATVREALLHLQHAGLVTRTPNAGTIVTHMMKTVLRLSASLPMTIFCLRSDHGSMTFSMKPFRSQGSLRLFGAFRKRTQPSFLSIEI